MLPLPLTLQMLDAGAWLRCFACGWNGARDYAAAINIALLGVAFLVQALAHTEQRNHHQMIVRP